MSTTTSTTAGQGHAGLAPPKAGDRFRCDGCGMALQVTADCKSKGDEHVHFHCCGREMTKV